MRSCAYYLAALMLASGCSDANIVALPDAPSGKERSEPAARQTQPASRRAPNRKQEPAQASPAFRPSDTRARPDDAKLAKLGIARYDSKRLVLYTDIDANGARQLPPLADALYEALVDYFGPLAPNREGTDYQITGYIIGDRELFRQAELLPDDLAPFAHGRHRGAEFWMFDQKYEYYRRHLMLHEITHCFMLTMPETHAPIWYLEGMAELFGTHRIDEKGTAHFRVMPADAREFVGWSRIEMVRRDVAAGKAYSLDNVSRWQASDFLATEPYAWSWALCKFLDAHPRYRDRFRRLGHATQGWQFAKAVHDAFYDDLPRLRTEWSLYVRSLTMGYDVERAAIDFDAGKALSDASPAATTNVVANRGWQPGGVLVEQGVRYAIAARGEVTLALDPKPWVARPDGISFEYAEGRPVGQLLAAVSTRSDVDDVGPESMLDVRVVGSGVEFTAAQTGALCFRVNDFWNALGDNLGSYRVEIKRLPPVAK